jgi:uncharacterized membrane protein YsdA (DUF1294 family)
MTAALTIYAVMSVVTFLCYWADKRRARAGAWRISEAMLHGCEVLGGWPGALLARHVLRHKSQKPQYRIVLWMIIGVHIAAWIWWLSPDRRL